MEAGGDPLQDKVGVNQGLSWRDCSFGLGWKNLNFIDRGSGCGWLFRGISLVEFRVVEIALAAVAP